MSRARDVADIQDNAGGAVPPFVAGKNKIINGDFGVWQRGTTFSNPTFGTYTSDRWLLERDGSGATASITQQAFTPGSAPVAGYESRFFFRYAQTVAGSGGTYLNIAVQKIEDVRTLAGQTVTFSFWAKADSNGRNLLLNWVQNFGTGGSSVVAGAAVSTTLTTSWVRYTGTVTLPSVSGKTISANDSCLMVAFQPPANTVQTFDIWGVQLEAGSLATPFTTATGTIQGELAACQRYYWRLTGTNPLAMCEMRTTTIVGILLGNPVPMRTLPTLDANSGTGYFIAKVANFGNSINGAWTLDLGYANFVELYATAATALTAGQAGFVYLNNASAYFGLSAEL
jgi:hypothetical protein